jgi:hypothetical protein
MAGTNKIQEGLQELEEEYDNSVLINYYHNLVYIYGCGNNQYQY